MGCPSSTKIESSPGTARDRHFGGTWSHPLPCVSQFDDLEELRCVKGVRTTPRPGRWGVRPRCNRLVPRISFSRRGMLP